MTGSPVIRPAPELPSGPRAALVIATNSYGDPVLRALRSPARDAAELAAVLADPQVGGFQVTTVLDPSAQQLRIEVVNFLEGRGPEDVVLVYLSCHGLTDSRRRLYFAAADTMKARLAATGVESSWLLDQLEECRARSQVLILDCCFSGAFARGAKAAEDSDLHDWLAPAGRGRAVLTASNAREYSFEGDPATATVRPGDTHPAPAGSVFTSALLAGLRTGAADGDGDGLVTVDDAYDYAYRHVRATGAAQTPQRWLSGGEGLIVLARNPAGVPISPAPVPDSLRAALDNPHPGVRMGAVNELADWLSAGEPGRRLAAQRLLQHIADTDIPLVGTAARNMLQQAGPPPAGPQPVTVRTARVLQPSGDPPGRQPSGGKSDTEDPPTHRPAKQSLASTEEAPTVLRGHKGKAWWHGGVTAVAFAPDGGLLATGSGDKTAQLWSPRTGQHMRTLTGHTGAVEAVTFSPDGKVLASGGADYCVRLWDPATGEQVRTLDAAQITAVAFSPDGHLLAAGAFDDDVRLWNPHSGELLRTFAGAQGSRVTAVVFAPDGSLLVSSSDDHTVRLWDPESGARLRIFTADLGSDALAFSPGGGLLAVGTYNGVALWDPETGEELRALTGTHSSVMSVAFSPDGSLLAGGGDSNAVWLWDPETGEQLRTLSGHRKEVNAVAFSPDGRLLATGSRDNCARVWRVR